MKKDRNINMAPYPMYPNYNGMMMPTYGMMPTNSAFTYESMTNNTSSSDITMLQNQIQNLDRRISRLESMINNTNKTTSFGSSSSQYTESNYHVM